ncbi:transporter substrate-binding domain-containing protein [Vibrio sp. MA40-2]|uniref:transporter substrate-binding domain-containing protein n=1 Tax=Vibrio sp. MA40-2 TaxID=3391828 RepID=UPI0039A5924E
MKRTSLLLVVLSSLLSTTALANNKPIRIATDATYPPFESVTADGEIVGFEVDIGNAICAEMNRKCEWESFNFDGLILGLKGRKFDIVFSSLGITEKRRKQVNFSDIVWTGYSSMLSRTDANLDATVEALKGKVVGVQMGTMQEEYVSERFGSHGVEVKTYQDQDSIYIDLLNGRIDASFQDMIQAQFTFIQDGKHSDFTNLKVEDALLPADSAVAIRKNDKEMENFMNEGLARIRANGTFDKIQRKYFGDLVLYKK